MMHVGRRRAALCSVAVLRRAFSVQTLATCVQGAPVGREYWPAGVPVGLRANFACTS